MSFEFQDFETLVEIPGEGQVRLVLSDDLDAAHAPLSPEMTARIADALDKAPGWLAVAEDREHGRGLQFAATETGGYTVVEYGGAEVAFY